MSDLRASTPVDLLASRARQEPDRELVRFDDGNRLRIGDVDEGSRALAAHLPVTPGTRVLTCVRPGRAAVELLFGLAGKARWRCHWPSTARSRPPRRSGTPPGRRCWSPGRRRSPGIPPC